MSIDFTRQEATTANQRWQKIRNITEGENTRQYLREIRKPSGVVDSDRTDDYRDGAIFYSVAGHTYKGMVGTVFSREPTIDLPDAIAYLLRNSDGAGNGIVQQSKAALSDVIRYGRAGLWVDYPKVDREVSRAEQDRFFATINRFEPWQIINWRTMTDGADVRLSLIVLAEDEEVSDGYEVEIKPIRRELALDDDGFYFVRKWVEGESEWVAEDPVYPTDSAGNRLRFIPFTFVGSENNDSSIDDAPMLDIVRVNIGHYRNSADFEDSVYYAGQAQPWMSGADDSVYELMKEHDFYIGSRMLMPVPSGERFDFATPDANPVVRQAMLDKVDQMVGLGARFIQNRGVGKTDFEAKADSVAQNSILAIAASNVSAAYERAISWVQIFMGAGDTGTFELSTDFGAINATPAMLAAWVDSYLKGSIPFADYVAWMKRQGFFDPETTEDEIRVQLDDLALTGPGGASDTL